MTPSAWLAILALSAQPPQDTVLAARTPKLLDKPALEKPAQLDKPVLVEKPAFLDKSALEELDSETRSFSDEAGEYLEDAQRLIEARYAQERARKGDFYERQLLELEKEERTERLDAIAVLERFLARFPSEKRATPAVMFRLAELYFERSSDEHLVAMRAHEEAVRKLDPKSGAEPPAEPRVNFRPSIDTYVALHERFPNFEHNDATWYLLGYCLDKQGDGDQALAAYRQVVERFPDSRLSTEAWLRIGESYFDNPEKKSALALATNAYEQALRNKDHPLYDKVLYKLGWTYYLTDRFDEAIDRFFDLLDYYARPEARAGGDLREEALQYMAISLTDERTGLLARARSLFERRGHRPWEAELYRRMGDIWLDRSNNREALPAFEAAIAAAPTAKDVPSIHQRIIETYRREQRYGEALAEAERLTKLLSKDSAWEKQWGESAEVLGNATAIAERTLSQVAIAQHQLAIAKLRAKTDARADFASAAKGYRAYLAAFPRSKQAYELEYYLADCLYGAEQYEEATAVYQSVRDSIAGTSHRKEAAWATVLGVQKQLDLARSSAKLATLPVKTSRDFAGAAVPEPLPLAPLESAFVAASDAFVAVVPASDKRASNVAYQAAELFYTHFDFDPARQRFEAIIARAPQSTVAPFASNLIIESYLIAKNWKAVEEVAARLSRNKSLAAPDATLFSQLTKFKLGGRFKLAESLMAEAKFAEAAAKYIELVDESPQHEFADKALNNAAICQENLKRFDSALKLYERIARDYPNSPLADGALFRVALNAQKSYDFPKAIEEYQRLVRTYPKSKEVEPALYNTARLLEGLQRYGEAAAAYARVASAFPESKDAPQNTFRAALSYAQQGAFPQEITALERFIKGFGASPAQNELTIDAYRRIGEAREKLKDAPGAKRAFRSALAEFERRGLKPEKAPIAAEAAAMSSFSLAEAAFAEFDALAIRGSKKALAQAFLRKKNALKSANDAYDAVVKYKRTSWIIAAFYRKGYLLERFAQTIVDAGANPPPEVKQLGEEAVISYQDQLSAQTVALEDKAVETYVAALAQARALRVSNVWTRRILESLHRFRPKEYPSLMETKTVLSVDKPYSLGLVPEASP